MRSVQLLSSAIALTSHVYAQVDSKALCDAVTKICYTSYTQANGIQIGIALPTTVTDPYDAIVKITAPIAVPWVGFAWGGTMTWNPLTVAWANGNTAVGSSRFAFGQSLPNPYDGSTLTLLKGTTTNTTHWTMTALCKGCTSWQNVDGNEYALNGTGTTQFAWARGGSAVVTPSSNTSDFNVHVDFGMWTHDLNAARSTNFNSWVSSNQLAAPTTSSASVSSTASSTTLTTSVKPSVTGKVTIPSSCSGAGAPVFSSVLASGWKATKVLGGLTSPRSLVWDSAGNLLMVQSGKGITLHKIDATGCVTSTSTLVALNSLNHGITFSADGKTLYASSMTTVYSWPYTASSATVGTRGTVVTGMFNGGSHTTRTLLIGAHAPDILIVSHGSNANLDTAAGSPSTGRAIIKTFDLTKVPSAGYNYVSGGTVMGYGLRNDIGMAFDGNNMLWSVENSADDFTRAGKDIHQNNPAEKLNYIGDVTKANNNWYGYPTCFAVWQASDFTTGLVTGDPFVLAPNATFDDSTCKTKITSPSAVFMAHSAPIDSKFDAAFSNLYVSFHGSWDRSPTTGFKLVQVPFSKGTDGSYKPSAGLSQTQYTDVMWNPDVTKCAGNGPVASSGCFRPAGLLFDSAGRLYMTSDTSSNAELWILGKA